jgi:hypothetical protein
MEIVGVCLAEKCDIHLAAVQGKVSGEGDGCVRR